MLVYSNDLDKVWKGEPINGVRHPRDIETKWSTEELSSIGLQIKKVTQEIVEESDTSVVLTLDEIKKQCIDYVNNDAENYRQNFITTGDGQIMTYNEKQRQSLLVLDLGKTDANALTEVEYTALYPTLAASVGIEADTLWDCAKLVETHFNAWLFLSNSIEKKRLGAIKSIKEATDKEVVEAIASSINWSEST